MAQQPQRGRSGTTTSVSGTTAPHPVSLKVLRLSPPSLATQIPLPATDFGNGLDVPVLASRAGPSALYDNANDATSKQNFEISTFPLTPLLTLPAAFGAAYVGEAFVCTLCANVDDSSAPIAEGVGSSLTPATATTSSVRDLNLKAELQTPSAQQGIEMELYGPIGEYAEADPQPSINPDTPLPSGYTLQRTIRHPLKDEGPHVLAVTLTYTETPSSGPSRVRTFRKLYQFVAQQLIAVRSKVTEQQHSLASRPNPSRPREWLLEAQLENIGDSSVVLERVWLKAWEGIGYEGMNSPQLRCEPPEEDDGVAPASLPEQQSLFADSPIVLKPQDIEQVMFRLFETQTAAADAAPTPATPFVPASRIPLAQLTVHWRGAMGEPGSFTTGWFARGRSGR